MFFWYNRVVTLLSMDIMTINKRWFLLVIFALFASSCETIYDASSKNSSALSLQTGQSFHIIKRSDNANATTNVDNTGARNPFKIIDEIANKQLTNWLNRASDIAPFNKSKPQKPLLPMPTLLRKDEFETTEAFGRRVAGSERQRLKELQKLEREFQTAIDTYNADVNIYNEAIANEKKRRQQLSDRKYWEFVHTNLDTILGQPQIAIRRYNADEQVFYAELVSTNSDLGSWVKVYVPISKAKSFKHNVVHARPILSLARDSNGELYLSGALVEIGTERYTAKVISRPNIYNPEHVVRSRDINVSDRYLSVNQ